MRREDPAGGGFRAGRLASGVAAGFVVAGAALLLLSYAENRAPSREGSKRGTGLVSSQAGVRIEDLAAGKVLVARRDLRDPNFFRTVVLLVRYGPKGAMGLIINRQMKLPISRLFDDLKEAEGRTDPVFEGGPVARTGAVGLLRAPRKPNEAEAVLGDIHLVSTRKLLEETLVAGTKSDAFRVYLGYSGWAPGQLEAEVEIGTWYIFGGDAGMVFDPDPQSVWERLIRRTEMRIARAAEDPIAVFLF
jgi:putative transcriptional regulator